MISTLSTKAFWYATVLREMRGFETDKTKVNRFYDLWFPLVWILNLLEGARKSLETSSEERLNYP